MSYSVIKLTQNDVLKLKVRARKKVPYEEIIRLLVEGYEVFIPDMNRKTASYVKRVLSNKVGVPVECFPSVLGDMNGYTFKLSIIQEYLSRLARQES